MDELTEREIKLLDFLKKMITAFTIEGIFHNRVAELTQWKNESLRSIGFSLDWQNEMLHYLETEFGIKYNKLDDNGNPLKEEDGNQT